MGYFSDIWGTMARHRWMVMLSQLWKPSFFHCLIAIYHTTVKGQTPPSHLTSPSAHCTAVQQQDCCILNNGHVSFFQPPQCFSAGRLVKQLQGQSYQPTPVNKLSTQNFTLFLKFFQIYKHTKPPPLKTNNSSLSSFSVSCCPVSDSKGKNYLSSSVFTDNQCSLTTVQIKG